MFFIQPSMKEHVPLDTNANEGIVASGLLCLCSVCDHLVSLSPPNGPKVSYKKRSIFGFLKQ